MASSPRRVGPETSKTRELLLDSVERLMVDDGYASVTYRALAAKAGVTPSLVQYYFPTLDDIFVAAWLSKPQANGEDVGLVLEAEIGTVEIGGRTIWSVFNIADRTSPHALAGLYQGGARYTWDGEETCGAIERSTPPKDLAW